MSVRDSRRAPFCWQSVDALELLRSSWDPADSVSLSAGLNVYRALTEIANETRARAAFAGESDGFEAARKQIAGKAGGIVDRTVDKALTEIERLGLLRVERRKVGGANLPSLYILVEPGSEMVSPGGEQVSLGVATSSREGGEINSPGWRDQLALGSRSKENEEVTPPTPPQGGPPTPPKNGRRREHDRYANDLIAFHEALERTPEAEAAWSKALERLRQLPQHTFDLWVEPLSLAGEYEGELYLTATPSVVTWIERRYRAELEAAITDYGVVVIPTVDRAAA